MESIIISCLESKKAQLIDHILHENNMVGRILEAENQSTISLDSNKVCYWPQYICCSLLVRFLIFPIASCLLTCSFFSLLFNSFHVLLLIMFPFSYYFNVLIKMWFMIDEPFFLSPQFLQRGKHAQE